MKNEHQSREMELFCNSVERGAKDFRSHVHRKRFLLRNTHTHTNTNTSDIFAF